MSHPSISPLVADYAARIARADVYDAAILTPLDPAARLSRRLGNEILLKREDLQPVFSFKCRGARNKIAHSSKASLANGVICSSAGNHAQGVALAAAQKGIRAVIVMPESTPTIKIEAVKAQGGEIVLVGQAYDDAYAHALKLADEEQLAFIHPFADPDVIAGQGTIARELVDQWPAVPAAVFVPVGGGGLIGGIGSFLKHHDPAIKIIGVEPVDAPSMHADKERSTLATRSGDGVLSTGLMTSKT